MAELHIPADDLRIGDLIHPDDGSEPIEVRALHRGERGTISVNPGDPDEIVGYIWQHAAITRKETTHG